ncbi:unnamed protein product [Gulo gulo]|uniref:Uncharacterized protein n=1 Tax=Gulo gulo TaxID=48420 RepID=A0A9X9PVA5_GULGU|nr:unnamed protein product [Gulo gulo]
MLKRKSMVFWPMLAKSEGRLPRWPHCRKRRRQAEPGGGCSSTLSMSCPPLGRRRIPRPTLKSVVILAFPDKDTWFSQNKNKNKTHIKFSISHLTVFPQTWTSS